MDVKQARRLKIGDRVSYGTDPTGPDYGDQGTVTKLNPCGYQVKWDDGQIIDYMNVHSTSIHKVNAKTIINARTGKPVTREDVAARFK